MAGLTALPWLTALAEPAMALHGQERLEWLLIAHDVRQALHAPRIQSGNCQGHAAGEK
jgi:hypothetical protein